MIDHQWSVRWHLSFFLLCYVMLCSASPVATTVPPYSTVNVGDFGIVVKISAEVRTPVGSFNVRQFVLSKCLIFPIYWMKRRAFRVIDLFVYSLHYYFYYYLDLAALLDIPISAIQSVEINFDLSNSKKTLVSKQFKSK